MVNNLLFSINNWYFVKQPIYYVDTVNQQRIKTRVSFYELLLRSKVSQSFPGEQFNTLIQTENGNQMVFDWIMGQLDGLLANNPATKFSINIDPKQMIYSNFDTFIKQLSKYSQQVIVEVTERVSGNMPTDILITKLELIASNKIMILLDDVDILSKNVNRWETLLAYVSGVKVSANLIEKINDVNTDELLEKIRDNHYLVGEGISDLNILNVYLNHQINYQQGWFLGCEETV